MCMLLFIGSDNELPTGKRGDVNRPHIWIDDIPAEYEGIRGHFAKKYQYIVYANVSCGLACGLRFNEAEEIDDIVGYDEAGRMAIGDLFGYIKKYVSDNHCELVSCWYGDEGKDLAYRDIINIDDFKWKNAFKFLQRQHITVYF